MLEPFCHLLQWDGVHVAQNHPAEGCAQVINHSGVGLFGQHVRKDRQHGGIITEVDFAKETSLETQGGARWLYC